MENKLEQLLATMTADLNPVKPAAKFERTPGQASIEK